MIAAKLAAASQYLIERTRCQYESLAERGQVRTDDVDARMYFLYFGTAVRLVGGLLLFLTNQEAVTRSARDAGHRVCLENRRDGVARYLVDR